MDETDKTSESLTEAPPAPPVPEQRVDPQAVSHFETPSWMRGPVQPVPPAVPEQYRPPPPPRPAPAAPAAPAARQVAIINNGHWAEHPKPRIFVGILLILSLGGLVASLIATITTQSSVAIAFLVGTAVLTVVMRGALMSSGSTITDLSGSRLVVRQDGLHEIFELTDPTHLIELVGRPEDSNWRLRLEKADGTLVELTANQVDPLKLHPAVEHYRAIAAQEKIDRERRFNR